MVSKGIYTMVSWQETKGRLKHQQLHFWDGIFNEIVCIVFAFLHFFTVIPFLPSVQPDLRCIYVPCRDNPGILADAVLPLLQTSVTMDGTRPWHNFSCFNNQLSCPSSSPKPILNTLKLLCSFHNTCISTASPLILFIIQMNTENQLSRWQQELGVCPLSHTERLSPCRDKQEFLTTAKPLTPCQAPRSHPN